MKKFKTHKEVREDRTTIYLIGELDLSTADDFRITVEPLIEDVKQTLVLDLQDLKYMDSTGIGLIISVLKARDSIKAPLIVESIPNNVKRLLDISGITPYLTKPSYGIERSET